MPRLSPFDIFMLEQVELWMEQLAIDPDLEVPVSVMRFYFSYKAKALFEFMNLDR